MSDDYIHPLSINGQLMKKDARIAELEAALEAEKKIWVAALLENIPEEKAILFRNICVSAEKCRAALKGEKAS
jgi:hypothetical protein